MKIIPYDIQKGLIYIPFSNKKYIDTKKAMSLLTDKMYPSGNSKPCYYKDKFSKKFMQDVEDFGNKYNGHLIINGHSNYGANPKLKSMQGGGTSAEIIDAIELLERIEEDIPKHILNSIKSITLLACYGGGLDRSYAVAYAKCGKVSVSFLKLFHDAICRKGKDNIFPNMKEIDGFTRAIAITGEAEIYAKKMQPVDKCIWHPTEEDEANTLDYLEFMGDSSHQFFDKFC